jgi:endonuclease G
MQVDRLNRLRGMIAQVNPERHFQGLEESLESRNGDDGGFELGVKLTNIKRLETEFALESLDVLQRGNEVDAEQQFAIEAIVMPYYRPVVDIIQNQMKTEQLTQKWLHLAGNDLRSKIEQCFLSVGSVEVPGMPSLPYAGTGFVVGADLMMTNRHVAQIFAGGLGRRSLQFKSDQSAAIDFYRESGRTESDMLTVERVVMIHPYWDMALLKVSGLPEKRPPLQLSAADPASMLDREIVVIGYPGYDRYGDEEFQRIQNRIFRGTYYVKRLQPGVLRVRQPVESFGRHVEAITHDCSTLGGNSGSAVLALPRTPEEPIQVIGLHFAGQYLVANYAVASLDLAQDSRVVDAGVNFAGDPKPRQEFYDPYWKEADDGNAENRERPPR